MDFKNGFHSHSNWFWNRTETGVSVNHVTANGEVISHELTHEAWASIVASMSKGGESDLRFYSALAFHHSVGHVDICKAPDTERE
jgi:hypothetical protein